MARADNTELIDSFEEFYRSYYRNEIAELAQKYPSEQKSLYIDWQDLYRFDSALADDFRNKPQQLQRYAEEALRLYDLPVDVSLGQAHVRVSNLPEATDIRAIRADHRGMLLTVQGIIRKATDVRPKVTTAAFECQRCGTLTRIPQETGDFQEPHECQGCERQGPFRINYDQSEFIDAQKLRVQESPEGLRGGETPQSIDINIEDDITGNVTAGDHVSVTGILQLDQRGNDREKSPMFDIYMDGMTVEIEDEEFEEMDITEEDKKEIVELSNHPNIYEEMQGAIAPSIYGYEREKLAMVFQLFSGVTKHLPDGSRTRGDLHMLLIGDPGTGKSQLLQYVNNIAPRSVYTSGKGSSAAGLCVTGDTMVQTPDGLRQIREIVKDDIPQPVTSETAVERSVPVYTFDRNENIVESRNTSHIWRMPKKPCRKLQTGHGKELEASVNTPVLTCGENGIEWKEISEIEAGESVAVPDYEMEEGEEAAHANLVWDEVVEVTNTGKKEVFDITVPETHNFIGNGIVTHNTAAAVRDDFGDGQQWSLEAGALVLADRGIAAVDELDKMRCVTGDTLVHTPDGIRPIREFARQGEKTGQVEKLENGQTIRNIDQRVWTMTEDGKIESRSVTAVHEYEAPETLCTVTLESGESVTATPDHPFIVASGDGSKEVPAAQLKAGEPVYVPRSLPPTETDGGMVVTKSNPCSQQDGKDVEIRRVETVDTVSNESLTDSAQYVYDLTVEGTHNFVANNIIIHNSEDQSAMHEALEQQSISVSKAGINATLKSRCSLLGAANPRMGRFDRYEPIGEQIDLEPPLISRFDLIFIVTDDPDEEHDAELAEHILRTNYAGELNTHRTENATSNYTKEEVERVTDEVAPTIDAEFLRKYVAYSKRNCFPTMTEEAMDEIQDFYVNLRSRGSDEDAPVPVTARKLEALVRLAEASARVRLSDTVELEDARRGIDIAKYCLEEIGMDPETGELDADMIETGTSKSQRDRIKDILNLIETIEEEYDEGAPVEIVIERAEEVGTDSSKAKHEIDQLKQKGEVYEPQTGYLRTT